MNIGSHTFEEYKAQAAAFHGYPAPGILIGGYMVAMAQKALPEGTLFEALVETGKCLPDAVQLLTLCSTGNNWMKVLNLGKYAVSLYDKHTGVGFRVHIDPSKLADYPEIRGWFLKEKAKKDQDTNELLREIEQAGDTVLEMQPIRVAASWLEHSHMQGIAICPVCHEAYPEEDGVICRGCQGEAPCVVISEEAVKSCEQAGSDTKAHAAHTEDQLRHGAKNPVGRVVSAEEAVGKKALHDMTQIIPDNSASPKFKDAVFHAGQVLTAGDVCRLQQMGRFTVAVEDDDSTTSHVHENEAAEAFAQRMAGTGVVYKLPPREGKINLKAAERGLLCIDRKRLLAFNSLGDVMCAARQDATLVEKDTPFAGTRAIPLYLSSQRYAEALHILDAPIFSIAPLRRAKAGILVTGTEVFSGLIEDKFVPIISSKLAAYGCDIVHTEIAPDKRDHLLGSIAAMREAGIDLLITTGGLSVDPDDITRAVLEESGLTDTLYGAPVLPGAMSLVGRIPASAAKAQASHGNHAEAIAQENKFGESARKSRHALPIHQPQNGEIQVIGVPACALYFKTTMFDILLPRMLAGRTVTRQELAYMGEGGFCAGCKVCTWPKCFMIK